MGAKNERTVSRGGLICPTNLLSNFNNRYISEYWCSCFCNRAQQISFKNTLSQNATFGLSSFPVISITMPQLQVIYIAKVCASILQFFFSFSNLFTLFPLFAGNREGKIFVWELQSSPPTLIARFVWETTSKRTLVNYIQLWCRLHNIYDYTLFVSGCLMFNQNLRLGRRLCHSMEGIFQTVPLFFPSA